MRVPSLLKAKCWVSLVAMMSSRGCLLREGVDLLYDERHPLSWPMPLRRARGRWSLVDVVVRGSGRYSQPLCCHPTISCRVKLLISSMLHAPSWLPLSRYAFSGCSTAADEVASVKKGRIKGEAVQGHFCFLGRLNRVLPGSLFYCSGPGGEAVGMNRGQGNSGERRMLSW
jgi:hypothetical protein